MGIRVGGWLVAAWLVGCAGGEPGDDTDTSSDTGDTFDTGTDTADTGTDTADTGTDTADTGTDTADTGTDTADTGTDTGDTAVPAATYTLGVPSSTIAVGQGSTAELTVTITGEPGFVEDVDVTVSGYGEYVDVDAETQTIANPATTAVFTLTAYQATPVGTIPLTVTATSSVTGLERVGEVSLQVDAVPSFSVWSAGQAIVHPGQANASVGLRCSRFSGFAEDVALTIVDLPVGVTMDVASVTCTEARADYQTTISIDPSVATGDYFAHVRGVSAATSTVEEGQFAFKVVEEGASGTPDFSFGDVGLADFTLDQGVSVRAVVVDPFGRIVVGGILWDGIQTGFVLRLDATGALDPSFGTGGVVKVRDPDFSVGLQSHVNDLMLTPTGEIYVAGFFGMRPESARTILTRLLDDGSVDETFGAEGWVAAPTYGAPSALTWAEDGDLLLGAGHIARFELVEVTTDGDLDTSFGVDGIVTFTDPGVQLSHMGVDNDGNAYVTGNLPTGSGLADIAIVALTPAGAVDGGYATDGLFTHDVDAFDGPPTGMLVRPAGRSILGMGTKLVAVRPNGTLDPDFGTAGTTTGFSFCGAEIIDDGDGHIVCALRNNGRIGVERRLLADGAIDDTFNGIGRGTVGADQGDGVAVAIGPDGTIVVAGHGEGVGSMGGSAWYQLRVARFWP